MAEQTRPDGYYWVMIDQIWVVARWSEPWWWITIGDDYTVNDDYFTEIGDRVERFDKSKITDIELVDLISELTIELNERTRMKGFL